MWIGATQGSAKACDGVDALQRRSVDSVTASSSDERVDKATRLAGYELASIHPVRRCDVGQQCIPVATWASSIIPGARAVTSTQRKR